MGEIFSTVSWVNKNKNAIQTEIMEDFFTHLKQRVSFDVTRRAEASSGIISIFDSRWINASKGKVQ